MRVRGTKFVVGTLLGMLSLMGVGTAPILNRQASPQSAPRAFGRGGNIDMGAQEQPTAEKSSGAAIAAMPRRSSSPFYLARAAAARATVALAKPQSQREAQSPLLAKLQTEEEAQLPRHLTLVCR